MAFTTPIFNLVMDVWNNPNTPSGGLPDFTGVPVQLYVGSKGIFDVQPASQDDWVPPVYLRVPTANYGDVKAGWIFFVNDAHGGGYYKARWKEFMHKGFPNEYYIIVVEQCDNAGTVPFFRNVIY